jgi:hypothetical protein
MADVDGDSSSSPLTPNRNSSSTSSLEFHENLVGNQSQQDGNNHCAGSASSDPTSSNASCSLGGKSVPPDFIPIRSSWRSSSFVEHEDEPEDRDNSSNNSPVAGGRVASLREREIRGETGSMKESKTFAFGLKHFTEADVINKGKN